MTSGKANNKRRGQVICAPGEAGAFQDLFVFFRREKNKVSYSGQVSHLFSRNFFVAASPGMFANLLYLCYIECMDYALKERIGKPELFTGRKQELAYFLKWINDIRDEKSQSTAILARRKMGKTV